MTNKIVLPVLGLLLLTVSRPAFAVDTPTPTLRPTGFAGEVRTDLKDMRRNIRVENKSIGQTYREERRQVLDGLTGTPVTKAERQAAMVKIQHDRVQSIYDRLVNEFNTRYQTYTALFTKLQARIAEKSATNDMTAANKELANFAQYQTAFTTDMQTLASKLALAQASSKPSTFIGQIKTAAKDVNHDLQNMRKVLTSSLRLMIRASKLPNSTVTPSPEAKNN
ncbi:MAG TPA: hypothetical protein VF828_05360 [Patescibacteria group bacterium]